MVIYFGWLNRRGGGHTWVGMHSVEFDILWYHDSAHVILNQKVNSKNSNPLTEQVLKINHGHFCIVKSEGLHTWVGVHIVEFGILWYHDTVQVILNQNVDSKNTNPLTERVLKVHYGHLFWMVKSEGGGAYLGRYALSGI